MKSLRQCMGVQTLEDDYKEITLFQQSEEQTQAAIHSQHSETLMMILKYY